MFFTYVNKYPGVTIKNAKVSVTFLCLQMSIFCVRVCVYVCKRERERETVCWKDFSIKTEVWKSLRNANGLRHLPTNQVPQSLQHPPTAAPAPHRHTMHNTPPHHQQQQQHDRCNSLWPRDLLSRHSMFTQQQRWQAGRGWLNGGMEIFRKLKGEERWEEVASGAFHTLSLITQTFCHAKGRSTSLTWNQGIWK